MKSTVFAAVLLTTPMLVLPLSALMPTVVLAQTAVPAQESPAAQPPAARPPATQRPAAQPAKAPRPVAQHAGRPAQTSPDVLDIVQIIAIRQIDPATYEIDARLQNGNELHLRANAFVLQSLGQQLGTYGK